MKTDNDMYFNNCQSLLHSKFKFKHFTKKKTKNISASCLNLKKYKGII